ncbi:nitric oxide synthase oxygenase [Geomicrobium sp. JCM 19039]|uniref:nitric oxide synthase oxygenase n=1 Tax=Geomicrobium sp. JCM 19039 TaxID=1460636 RepID=UPI00045F4B37|nr:nitric oxide synthase oxygenase [Geomicrobium sp. JCM 19039]GAK10622.1 nitric oxide synthase oxygenase [Geomicrobium sp. JCM 19039]
MNVQQDAQEFLRGYYQETNQQDICHSRWNDVQLEIERTGTYVQTTEELTYGARVAWRNSNRCIGRLFWNSLEVVDARHVESTEDIFLHLENHIVKATNNGRIRSLITVFPAAGSNNECRIWNHQLIRYAGYERDGEIIGDAASIPFTQVCEQLGWRGKGTEYDVLPFVVQFGNAPPQLKEVPEGIVREVAIKHPKDERFDNLHLQWYAVPIISDMSLSIGGVTYPASPFNGWYMGTEIGARNLADEFRYHKLPEVADALNIPRGHPSTLWKDEALVELNRAVLHSYQENGVTIVDHHTAAKQFEYFQQLEKDAGREVTGDWTWLIPPMSPATTAIFHQEIDDQLKLPNYLYQRAPYKED